MVIANGRFAPERTHRFACVPAQPARLMSRRVCFLDYPDGLSPNEVTPPGANGQTLLAGVDRRATEQSRAYPSPIPASQSAHNQALAYIWRAQAAPGHPTCDQAT